jgi:hypothetical protein
MAKMTPEQEAAYALDYDLGRDGLKPAVRPVYDRLLEQRRIASLAGNTAAAASRRAAAEVAAKIAAKQARVIPMVTTDALPASLTGEREVKRAQLVSFSNYTSMEKAEKALITWVQMNDYDAVVGVSFLAVPHVSAKGSGSYGTSPTTTDVLWAVYGTAIAW